jgi:hypothetical protein
MKPANNDDSEYQQTIATTAISHAHRPRDANLRDGFAQLHGSEDISQKTGHTAGCQHGLPQDSTDFGAPQYQRDPDKPLGGVGHDHGPHLRDQAHGGESVGAGGHDAGRACGAPKYQGGTENTDHSAGRFG